MVDFRFYNLDFTIIMAAKISQIILPRSWLFSVYE